MNFGSIDRETLQVKRRGYNPEPNSIRCLFTMGNGKQCRASGYGLGNFCGMHHLTTQRRWPWHDLERQRIRRHHDISQPQEKS